MNLLRRLFGGKSEPRTQEIGFIPGPGTFQFDIVGESFYQDSLEKLCGKRTKKGAKKIVKASLICDDNNPHDNQAVRVDVEGLTVGHLPRAEARNYRKQMKKYKQDTSVLHCQAMIVGGWKDGDNVGHFGVKLDLPVK